MRISIIGAGPAGAMAAARLARAGAAVTLFDPSHPREKPCGGGLTGRALALISDVLDIDALPAVVIRSARVEAPVPRERRESRDATVDLVDRGLSSSSSLVVLSRAVFDKALADAAVDAGARLIPQRVVDVIRRGNTMFVRTVSGEHSSEFVLGGDGASSVVRKKLSRPFSRREMSIAAGFFAHNHTASEIVVKCMAEQPGYLWSFPRPDHLAVGVCAPASGRISSSDLLAQSRTWIHGHLGRDRCPAAKSVLQPYAWPIPSVGFTHASQLRAAAGPGWMLLGDAAGLVDPLTREGIYYALLSGQWAAEALARWSTRAGPAYVDRLIDELHPELQRAATLSEVFFSTAFSTLFVTALRQSAPIRQIFADLVAGTQPYEGLRRRLLGTGEWRLAGHAARIMFQSHRSSDIGGTIGVGATP